MSTWHASNHRYMLSALTRIRSLLQSYIVRRADPTHEQAANDIPKEPTFDPSNPPALVSLATLFGLSAFERDVLLLCAGMDLDGGFTSLCAAAHGDPHHNAPTFALAMAALPNPDWRALTPAGPLRRWRLIEIGSGAALTLSPLRIGERVLHFLTGFNQIDERLRSLVTPVQPPSGLAHSQQLVADKVAAALTRDERSRTLPIIQLCGIERGSKYAVAAIACAALNLRLYALKVRTLPASGPDLETMITLTERETTLGGNALLLDCDDHDQSDTAREHALSQWIEQFGGLLLITTRERRAELARVSVAFDIDKPSTTEQRSAWQAALGPAFEQLNGEMDVLVSQFNLSTDAINSASYTALRQLATEPKAELSKLLWDTCKAQARPRLEDLAQRISSKASWGDLVLPDGQRQILRDVAAHVRQRSRVYETWGFADKGARGLGLSAMFAGTSGTGKTMAAEVLANELGLDLYRIDLSSVVSKYIGETEKNLRRIFDAAEDGGAILLFDEADALFGKRSEVKDSHDRYANIEVSYLLQRMEAYRGLAILTTNLKSSLDTAFLRRIRFVIQFPFPDPAQRAEIWRRVFPPATPTEGLDVERLARLNVAGGNIKNIALNAAFLAADEDSSVQMRHLLRAARAEYAKLEKTLTDAETAGWV